ncbi:MAG TPA: hypothetical protein VGF18_00350 [Candidatus Tumulicola sp.]|jgi:hypothetical protein
MQLSSIVRNTGVGALVIAAVAFAAVPGQAQMRQQMMDKVAVQAAHNFVTKIGGESCSDFAATMKQMKGQSGGSSSSMSSKLKSNPEARTQFVNIVAAPLLNKMIDCNMTGGM